MHSCGSWTLALLVFLAFSGPVSGGASSDGMHVVWIIADDMGPQLGCYGTPGVRTPNLDRLAAEGMRFTNAFSSAPVCSSSRSAIITGMHQSAINAHQHRTISKPPLPDGIAPLPVILAEAGVSSFNGNFNLGKPGKRDYNFAWSGPALYAGNDWATGAREDPDDRQRFFQQVQIFEPHRRFRKNTVPAREMVLEVPSWLPDTPLVRADEAGYLESIEVLDRKVGRILQRIDSAGETERTVVIFLGDHGRPQVRSKQWLYNAGLHVPLIIRWPGVVPAGVLNEELVCLVDLAPTTLAVMGVDVPDWMHGRVLVGPDREPPVDVVCPELKQFVWITINWTTENHWSTP